jgi:DNA-binding transcriptional regulator GbsR (MarR family)
MTALVAAVLQSAMLERPRTYDEMTSICGLSKPAVARLVRLMHHAGFVYVAGWTHDTKGRLFVAQWGWGRMKDAPRPGPVRTPAERMRALRESRSAK